MGERIAVATGFAPTSRRATSPTAGAQRPTSLQMACRRRRRRPILAAPVAVGSGRALLSWGNAPYIAGAAFCRLQGIQNGSVTSRTNKPSSSMNLVVN